MPGFGFDAQEEGIVAGIGRLQYRREFFGVQRDDAIIGVGRCN